MWEIGINKQGELHVTRDGEHVVGFTPDFTYELYLAMHSYYSMVNSKVN